MSIRSFCFSILFCTVLFGCSQRVPSQPVFVNVKRPLGKIIVPMHKMKWETPHYLVERYAEAHVDKGAKVVVASPDGQVLGEGVVHSLNPKLPRFRIFVRKILSRKPIRKGYLVLPLEEQRVTKEVK